jgi:hypothetical protein
MGGAGIRGMMPAGSAGCAGLNAKSLGAAPCAAVEGLPGLRYGTAEPGEVEE